MPHSKSCQVITETISVGPQCLNKVWKLGIFTLALQMRFKDFDQDHIVIKYTR